MIKKYYLSIITAIVILYLSLFTTPSFPKLIDILWEPDKIIHVLMYGGFTAVLLFESRKGLTIKKLFMLSIIPLLYGGLMELLQELLTTNRTGSIYDFIANSAGVVICDIFSIIKPFKKVFFK